MSACGEAVWLDYQPVYVSVADEIVDNAVAMANGMVENELDPDRQFEVDPTLAAGATYRALEIVCRAAASRELSAQRGGDRMAATWLKLADLLRPLRVAAAKLPPAVRRPQKPGA